MTFTMRVRDEQAYSSRACKWRVTYEPPPPLVFQVFLDDQGDLIPYPTTSADWIAWGRGMMGGDTSHMLDIY
jgi:hypothetical protein